MNYRSLILFTLFICPFLASVAPGQEAMPREYQLEEFVSFDKKLPINEAINILSQFSQKYENKIIVDDVGNTAPIDVTVEKMHWKRALEYILRSNDMAFEENENYYRIVNIIPNDPSAEKKIDWNTREVEIDATFFEADYDALSEVGVDWSTLSDGKVKLRIEHNGASQAGQSLSSASVAYVSKFISVAALIRVFEGRQLGKVLANPQIRIMDGKEGKIQVGNNFYLTTRDFAGNTRFSEYEAGTILTVTPRIIEQDGRLFIYLIIKAEKSNVVQGTNGVVKKVTDGQTEVLMLDGEETAMAGLFSSEENRVRKGIPLLKDLPWWVFGIRYLAGYNSVTIKKKELIILLKADIVPSLADRINEKKKTNYYLKQKELFREKASQFKDAK